MSGQFRKDPFHINRDSVDDNHSVTRSLRLPRGSQIRVQRQDANVLNIINTAVPMPFTGNLFLTISGTLGGGAFTVFINNPFVRTTAGATLAQNIASNFAAFSSRTANSTASITAVNPGQITLTLTNAVTNNNGLYVLSVGRRTDRRNNGYSQ